MNKPYLVAAIVIFISLSTHGVNAWAEHKESAPNKKLKETLAKLKRGEHVTIVALGDSITANTLHNRGCMNWVSLLNCAILQTYGKDAAMIINAGIAGSSYSKALKRLDRDVLRFKPDLVIIALGMNDAFEGIDYLPQFKKEVSQAIELIRRNCNSEVLLMTPNPIVIETGGKWKDDMLPGNILQIDTIPLCEYSKALVEIAEEKKCVIVDHYNSWKSAKVPADMLIAEDWAHYQFRLWPRMANSTHPGPLGHMAFYREIAEVFELPRYFGWEVR